MLVDLNANELDILACFINENRKEFTAFALGFDDDADHRSMTETLIEKLSGAYLECIKG